MNIQGKSPADNIWVQDIMITQKGQSQKKVNQEP